MTKLYSMFTPSHGELKERYFDPTVPSDVEVHMRFFPNDGEGSIQDDSWRRAIHRKIEIILEAIEENWDEVFVFSDVDVQFFGSFASWVPPATANHDLAFQIDAPGPALCTGFFFCRANETTRSVWRRVQERVRETDAREDDQATLRKLIWKMPNLRWTCLPPIFHGGGTLSGEQWTPGKILPLPEGLLLHHANFTCGVPNKLLQSEHVRERLDAPRISLREAYARVGAPEGFTYGPSDAESINVTLRSPTPYAELLRTMAGEPDFHPYAAEAATSEFLESLVHLLGATSVLELGTHKGFTTIHLARALADNPRARLVTVDSKDQRSDSLRTLDGSYLFVRGHDLEVVPTLSGEFDLVYIDTTHRYEHTVAEIGMLSQHSPRAVLVLHDVLSCPEVRRAIDQFADRYARVVLPTPPHPTLGWTNGLAILQPKVAAGSNA